MEKQFLLVADNLVSIQEIVLFKNSEQVAGFTEVHLKNGAILYYEKSVEEVKAELKEFIANLPKTK